VLLDYLHARSSESSSFDFLISASLEVTHLHWSRQTARPAFIYHLFITTALLATRISHAHLFRRPRLLTIDSRAARYSLNCLPIRSPM
jgi:hypothetical protein